MQRRRSAGTIRGAAEVGKIAIGLLGWRVLDDPGSGGAVVQESGEGAFSGDGAGGGEV